MELQALLGVDNSDEIENRKNLKKHIQIYRDALITGANDINVDYPEDREGLIKFSIEMIEKCLNKEINAPLLQALLSEAEKISTNLKCDDLSKILKQAVAGFGVIYLGICDLSVLEEDIKKLKALDA